MSWLRFLAMRNHNCSFDYDNTLIRYFFVYDQDGNVVDAKYSHPHEENINLLREIASSGSRIYIVTARIPEMSLPEYLDNSPKPEEFIKSMNLPIEKVIYTSNQCKVPALREYGIKEHWDDCPEQCRRIQEECDNIKVNLVAAPDGINEFMRAKFIKILSA
jgi:hypothetical protein